MSSESNSKELRTYRGNCHCGAFVYEAALPEITTVTECPCSICHKKGYIFVGTNAAAHFKVVKGSLEDLTEYTFGSGKMKHKFCPVCATGVLATCPSVEAPGKDIFLNVHGIQGVNTWTLERSLVDGTKLGSPYEEPQHRGPLPTAEIPDGKLYTGSCHCGKLTIALLSKPLEDEDDAFMLKCNCSICERHASLWVYPKREQVVIHGAEADIGRYSFGNRILAKPFCRTCGVSLTNPVNEALTQADKDALIAGSDEPDKIRGWLTNHALINPVNVRVLHGLDLARVKVKTLEGATLIKPPYVNP